MADSPLMLAYGLGVDSTAVLVGWRNRGIRPDAILFADVKSEKKETYAYLPVIQAWLAKVGFPPVTVVEHRVNDFKHWPPYYGLEENCLTNGTLPSLAFGFKSCSLKWKVTPQNAWTEQWQPAIDCWAAGGKVRKAIGYDASPKDRKRFAHAIGVEDPAYEYLYPLIQWGADREACKDIIRLAGLPVPPKSACVFCLAGETEVLTRGGIKKIADLAGGFHELLVPLENGYYKDGAHGGNRFQVQGVWKKAEVRSFGRQGLLKLWLQRGSSYRKEIRVTPEHRWQLVDGRVLTTSQLRPGMRLAECRATGGSHHPVTPGAVGIMQGFVFGDGSVQDGRNSSASVDFFGTKHEDMAPWFSSCRFVQVKDSRGRPLSRAVDLPRAWKACPDLRESRSHLLGWLAGYFAADGAVSKNGSATMESSWLEDIMAFRDVCHVLGVRTGPVVPHVRTGKNGRESIHRISMCSADLPESFWLRPHHAARVVGREFNKALNRNWVVKKVESVTDVEEVFCAIVPGVERFTLADQLLTLNCPATTPKEIREFRKEYLRRIVIMEARAKPRLMGCWDQAQIDAYNAETMPKRLAKWEAKRAKWERDTARWKEDHALWVKACIAADRRGEKPDFVVEPRGPGELPKRPEPYKVGDGTAGLWRSATKTKPAMITDFILKEGLLPAEEVAMLQERAPKEIIDNIQAFANGEFIPSWHDFLEQFTEEDALDELPGACGGCQLVNV